MKIPEKVKISGLEYEIMLANRYGDHGARTSGTCDNNRCKIWIDTGEVPQCCQESTLFHEIIEAINSTNDLGLSHTQISVLETILYAVLIDNNFLK